MNKILVEVSVGELLDKISILEIKKEKISNPESLEFIEKEYLILKDQLDKNIKSDEKLDELFKSLKEINSKLWVFEDEKRLYEKNSDFGETLHVWGVSEGPYIELPIFGPSTMRHTFGRAVDLVTNPISVFGTTTEQQGAMIART